mgnify:CR=1 FL=1
MYFSSFYELSLRSAFWHAFLHIHFVIIGSLLIATTLYILVALVATGALPFDLAMRALERRALSWHSSVRGEVAV